MKVKERHLQPRAAKKFFQMKMQSGGDKQREGDKTLKSTDGLLLHKITRRWHKITRRKLVESY